MLGHRQRETLNDLAEAVRSFRSTDETIVIQVVIMPYCRFTREMGGGAGHAISAGVAYINALAGIEDRDTRHWISTCGRHDEAVRKAQEVARYLLDNGIPREMIRVRNWTPQEAK